MRIRIIAMFGLTAALLSLTFVSPAHAQRGNNVGQQMERQLMNNLGSSISGQPNYPYPNQSYNAYQGIQGGYGQSGYPMQRGPGYFPQGTQGYQQPYRSGSYTQQSYYPQQPQTGYYPQQQPQQGYYPQQPATTQRYQLPAQFAGTAPGSSISYGGVNYVVNVDGTMSPGGAAPAQLPESAPRYQLPSQFTATAPGSVIGYNGASYVINNDGTMSPSGR